MGSLDDLLKLKGVVAAGEFTADGKLIDYSENGHVAIGGNRGVFVEIAETDFNHSCLRLFSAVNRGEELKQTLKAGLIIDF